MIVSTVIHASAFAGRSATLAVPRAVISQQEDGISALRVIGSLALCLLLAVGGAFALRARLATTPGWRPFPSRPKAGRRLRHVETLRLSPHVQLSLVTFDDSEILLAVSPHGARMLRPSIGPGEAVDDPAAERPCC